MPTDPAADLELAIELADAADRIALGVLERGPLVERKPDGSVVTDADRAIEAMIRHRLLERRPAAAVIGEELGSHGSGPVRWVIDPIDGTAHYASQRPGFALLLACEVDGEVTVGVVSAPALGLRWWAARGHGSWSSSPDDGTRRSEVTTTVSLAEARGVVVSRAHLDRFGILGRPGTEGAATRLSGRGAELVEGWVSWEVARVATGEADFAITAGSWWDVAAQTIIVTEAGGRADIHDVGGTPPQAGIVVSNSAIAADLELELTRDRPGERGDPPIIRSPHA